MKKATILSMMLFLLFSPALWLVTDVKAQVPDTSPPQLLEFDFAPSEVGIDEDVTFTMRVTEDISGLDYVRVRFISPSGQQETGFSVTDGHRISGDTYDGVYQYIDDLFQPFAEEGTWHILYILTKDLIENERSYNESELIAMGFPTTLKVTSVAEIEIDIKPGSCNNPCNLKSKGYVAVAILGTVDFDVSDIDLTTIELEGAIPHGSAVEDVSTTFMDNSICTELGPDGIDDLRLKFDGEALVAALGEVNDGDVIELTLTGELFDGTPIEGTDSIVVLDRGGGQSE